MSIGHSHLSSRGNKRAAHLGIIASGNYHVWAGSLDSVVTWPLSRKAFSLRVARRCSRSFRATISSITLPLYFPHEGHARWERRMAPHSHLDAREGEIAAWERRMPVFDLLARIRTTMDAIIRFLGQKSIFYK